MTLTAYREIPEYLHCSAFYCSLSGGDDDEEIQVPDDCFKADDKVLDFEGFRTLLKVTMFWGLDTLPRSILIWCRDHPLDEWEHAASEILGGESSLITPLRRIFDRTAPHARFQRAVETNQPDILEVLVSDSTTDEKCSEGVTEAAARLGHLGMLKMLHDYKFFWDEEVCAAAAGAGHLACLQFAVEHGCDWDEGTCRAAATSGQLECLKYAFEHQCPWDRSAGQQAAANGHAECLQYVIETDPIIDTDDYDEVLRHGHVQCLKVLQAHHYPWSDRSIVIAAKHGHLDCVQYLHEECACEWDQDVVLGAAEHNHLEVLKYALDYGCECRDDVLVVAAHADSLECMLYLLNERSMHMSERLFAYAFNYGSMRCVQYLLDTGCPFMGFQFKEYPDSYFVAKVHLYGDYDARLVECIKLVCAAGWVVSNDLCWFVKNNERYLPLCMAHLQNGNYIK